MRRVHAHPQRGRGCVVETVAFSRCFPGTRRCVRENYTLTVSTGDTQHAGHVFVFVFVYTGPLVYIAAIVHGEQPLSTRARIPANIDPVVARDGSNGNSISLPPSAHRNLCFLRNPRPSSHHS